MERMPLQIALAVPEAETSVPPVAVRPHWRRRAEG